jgi:exosortase/archaeosortase family protein
MEQVITTTGLARWERRLESIPPIAWLGLQAAALWTHWRWAASRMADGSDDPLGLAALAVLLWAAWRLSPRMVGTPRAGWLAAALALSGAATASVFFAPPLLGAVLAAVALACGLRAFLPAGEGWLPMAGLMVLALPVVSSMQFYAGYPLRVVTAQVSTWALQLAGMDAVRSGSAMQVEGRLVIVDAPCSGVQMVWLAYFCACAVAAVAGLSDRRLLGALPFIGVLVMAGNVVRNTLLVGLEARSVAVSDAMHQAIGLVVLGAVCAAVVAIVRGARDELA